MLVHFPIVCLLFATISGIFHGLVSNPGRALSPKRFPVWMLALGVVFAWLSILTGQRSYNVVVRTICDPPALQKHQLWSYVATIVYSSALLLQLVSGRLPEIMSRLFHWFRYVLLLIGAASILYSAHLGGAAVYQQGAGTYKPSADCGEFSK